MAKRPSGKLEPVVSHYPICAECKHPFVLKLVMVFDRNHGGTGKTMVYQDFLWVRDCKHKRALVIIKKHSIPQPRKSKAKKTPPPMQGFESTKDRPGVPAKYNPEKFISLKDRKEPKRRASRAKWSSLSPAEKQERSMRPGGSRRP